MKRLLSLVLAAILLLPTTGWGKEDVKEAVKERSCSFDFPRHIGNDLKYTFWNGWHLATIAVSVAGLAGLHEADPGVQRKFQSRPMGSTFDNVMKWGFNPFILTGGSLLALGFSELVFDSPKVSRTVGAMFESLLLTETITLGLQLATHRRRPDGSNSKSFPSGHTSGAFALAAVTQGLYGPWYGVPAFALASLVGVSRLDSNRHVLTDVAAGALLGTLIGLGTAKFHKNKYPRYFLVPMVGEKTAGLSLVHTF